MEVQSAMEFNFKLETSSCCLCKRYIELGLFWNSIFPVTGRTGSRVYGRHLQPNLRSCNWDSAI